MTEVIVVCAQLIIPFRSMVIRQYLFKIIRCPHCSVCELHCFDLVSFIIERILYLHSISVCFIRQVQMVIVTADLHILRTDSFPEYQTVCSLSILTDGILPISEIENIGIVSISSLEDIITPFTDNNIIIICSYNYIVSYKSNCMFNIPKNR